MIVGFDYSWQLNPSTDKELVSDVTENIGPDIPSRPICKVFAEELRQINEFVGI
jgi:hypothetical protein